MVEVRLKQFCECEPPSYTRSKYREIMTGCEHKNFENNKRHHQVPTAIKSHLDHNRWKVAKKNPDLFIAFLRDIKAVYR